MFRKTVINKQLLVCFLAVILAMPFHTIMAGEITTGEYQEENMIPEEGTATEEIVSEEETIPEIKTTPEEPVSEDEAISEETTMAENALPEEGMSSEETPEAEKALGSEEETTEPEQVAGPFMEDGKVTEPETEEPMMLSAAKAALLDFSINKTGYTGYSVIHGGFDDYGTIGVFIPSSMRNQQYEFGADGGLKWVGGRVTYYPADGLTDEPVTISVLAGLEYQGPVTPGITRISGSAYLILKDRAYDAYGNTYDVRIDYSNFEFGQVRAREDGEGGVLISELLRTGDVRVCSFALQPAVEVYGDSVTGTAMDVDVTVLDKNGNALSAPTIFYVEDIDASDHDAIADHRQNGTVYRDYRYDNSGNPLSFIESVFVRTQTDEVYVSADNVLDYTIQGGRFIGTQLTGSTYSHPQEDAAILFETTTDNIHFSWTGSQCATALFVAARSYTVTSNVVGDHPDGGTITNGGRGPIAVPYKMDYGLQIKAAPGFVPEKIWVDGELINMDEVVTGSEGFYLFEAVAANHTIDVSFVPIRMDLRITKTSSETGEPLSGAKFTLWEWNGSKYTPAGEDSVTVSAITEIANGVYTGSVTYSPQNEGKFKIVETEAPKGYVASYEEEIRIDPDGEAVQSFTGTAENSVHYVSITIVKNVPAEDLYKDHGSADFVFRIDGIDGLGNEKTYYRLISINEEDANAEGMISKSAEVLLVPEGSYTVTELETSRFILTDMEALAGDFTVSKEVVRQTVTGRDAIKGFAGGYLTADQNEVSFTNRKEKWDEFSHSSCVVNSIGSSL